MQQVTFKSAISETFSSVRNFSFEEKKSFLSEEKVNELLDAILEFNRIFNKKTTTINSINEKIEKLTWFNDLNNETLLSLNDLISSIKDVHSTLIKQYVSLNYIRSKGIAKEEIAKFKNALDDLKESYQDLESIFFFLPEMPDFKETTKQLSLI
jgi:hypothetical protein